MKNKILIFVGGLFVGVTVGVLFSVAIKTLIGQFKELHISLNKINLKQSQLSQRLDSIQGKLVPDAKKVTSIPVVGNSKSTPVAAARTAANLDNSKQINGQGGNTARLNSTQDSDVVVMTNQLVSVISAPMKNKDTASRNIKTEETDSTLASMSDVGDPKEPVYFRIEFWKSPLNYKGYKMSKGKLVLYGLNPVAAANLVKQDGSYYFLMAQNAFKVEYTDEYKPFERVTDKAMLKKMGL